MSMTALYPGSFDPLTNGHMDIITRGAAIADRLIIAIGSHHEKRAFLPARERQALIENEVKSISGHIEVIVFNSLVVEAALSAGANVLIRGLRNGADFDYEMQMAGMNGALAPQVETIFLAASPGINYISSSLVRQISAMGGDISSFVPASIARAILPDTEDKKQG